MPHTEEMIAVNDTNVRVLRGGREGAPPLVFLHGAGGHTGWMSFLDALAGDFAVFAPEHPGFGRSDDPPWLDEVGDLAYFYLDFIEALGLSGVHLMGTSLGGWIAAELAVRNQTRLKTLTLAGAVGITAEGKPIDDIFRMSVEENLRRFYADPERAARRLGDMAKIDAMLYAKNRSTVTRLAYNPRFFNPGLARWLHRITVPTLLIYGDKDGLVPPQFGAAYHAAIPGSRFVVLKDAGHAPFDERRDDFLAAFRGFAGL